MSFFGSDDEEKGRDPPITENDKRKRIKLEQDKLK